MGLRRPLEPGLENYLILPKINGATLQLSTICSFTAQFIDFALTGRAAALPRAALFEGDHGMATGTVKWFNTTKGFGFIAPDGGTKDVFVHISAVERSGLTGLADNQKVSFDMQPGRDGRESAVDLKLL